jgi:hypothetical protein
LILLTDTQATYFVFKRYEPDSPLPLLVLLGVIPGIIANHLLPILPNNILLAALSIYTPYFSLIFAFVAAYRLSPFHPLAKYPGPILNKLSKFRVSWILAGGKVHIHYQDLHKEYGDVVRVGKFKSIDYVGSITQSNDRTK